GRPGGPTSRRPNHAPPPQHRHNHAAPSGHSSFLTGAPAGTRKPRTPPAQRPHRPTTRRTATVRTKIRSGPLLPASALRAEPSAPFLISPPQPEGEIRSGADGKTLKTSSLRPERGKPQGNPSPQPQGSPDVSPAPP